MDTETTPETTAPKKMRGLACLSPERRQEIARKGGQAAYAKGVTKLFDNETGSAAGKLGGFPTHRGPRKIAERRSKEAAQETVAA